MGSEVWPPAPGPNEVTGRLVVTRDGTALVADDRGRPLLAVGPDRLSQSGAMHGDTVVARPLRSRGAGAPGRPYPAGRPHSADRPPQAQIVRIVERANATMVGTYHRSGREEWVVPDDRRLPPAGLRGSALGALPGEKVVVAVESYPGPGRPEPVGRIVERLGPAGEPDVETLAVIRSLGLRDTFPEDVLAEAEALPRETRPAEREGRLDLTGETVFTIDDADARDLDDAISLWPGPGKTGHPATWRLGVHIADVSHYVPLGSALDREAQRRGTSVYLVDRVLPMFPTRLSNGIASLHPGVDRLTVTVFMDIDGKGRVVGTEIQRSVIRSVARLTYDAVAAFLRPEFGDVLPALSGEPPGATPAAAPQGPPGAAPATPPPTPLTPVSTLVDRPEDIPAAVRRVLPEMARLATRLRHRRLARGSLDFDLPEEKVLLDGEGRPVALVRRPRNAATQIIEEFMIAANEAVADFLLWNGVPYISRIHEEPFPDDLEALRALLGPLGYRVPTVRGPRPADLQAVLEAARGRPEGQAVHAALLKALPQARYSATPRPHFALASSNYLHFTSPIRRYPDLTVHRQVVAVLEGKAHDESLEVEDMVANFPAVAEASSRAERLAERAEADSLELKKTQLALTRLGSVEDGEVVDVFGFGAFVRLPDGIEGLVPAAAPGAAGLRVGQRVRVQIVRVDLDRRHIELGVARPRDDPRANSRRDSYASPGGGPYTAR